ncbi:hypothetical protein RHMOL_Rhmol05G0166500 [Rhododendron molle]|uniref:Uncharacterized protein n=1 Tax=Rhododendron molle TaxID=49168 RepID=A0ACC0NQ06_RHOML|nr:hypothetical protein RHMOL_Rhmol05G0166500 [Rhododendron molle]
MESGLRTTGFACSLPASTSAPVQSEEKAKKRRRSSISRLPLLHEWRNSFCWSRRKSDCRTQLNLSWGHPYGAFPGFNLALQINHMICLQKIC